MTNAVFVFEGSRNLMIAVAAPNRRLEAARLASVDLSGLPQGGQDGSTGSSR
ncbi:MAG TPA: hypothetical protein VG843_12425 [Rhizomicrobium sp.]|nr:hypothetical protein [Rhizomicrobium sp.]